MLANEMETVAYRRFEHTASNKPIIDMGVLLKNVILFKVLFHNLCFIAWVGIENICRLNKSYNSSQLSI